MIKFLLKSIVRNVSTEDLNTIYDIADEEMWARGEKKEWKHYKVISGKKKRETNNENS